MKISKFTNLMIAFIFFLIIFYSLKVIVKYYDENGLIYLQTFGTYYIFFFVVLLIAFSLNYYISVINI
jgi:hypothetical protein